jgi:hypothetical protein
MSDFKTTLSSPLWWISVVVVGMLINLASAYLKPLIDKFLFKVSLSWRRRTARQREERARLIEMLHQSKEEMFLFSIEEVRFRMRALHFILYSLLFLVMSQILALDSLKRIHIGMLVLAAIALFVGQSSFSEATRLWKAIHESRSIKEIEKTG